MRKRIFTSTIAALALFVVVGLVAALAIAWPNLARAHSPGGASLTALTVTSDGTALPLTPTFSSTVHYYTVPVANTVTQITIEATPGGDGTVAYAEADGTALPDADANTPGQQVAIPTAGKRINVEVTHTDGSEVMEETYGVLVIREGPAVPDTIVLMALYDSTNGEGWTTNTNWGSTVLIEDWHGVTTDANGRVTALRLRGNDLSGTLPASLGNLTNLQELSLNDSKYNRSSSLSRLSGLSGTIPASLGNLTKLTRLSLARNRLTGEIPEELGNLASLQYLYLNNNQLTGEIPEELGNLASLLYLYLDNNQLTGEIPEELGNLTNLQELYLNENYYFDGPLGGFGGGLSGLSGTIPASLGNLTKLTRLYLYNNQLTGEIPEELGNLTSLTRLYLYNNQLTGEIPEELGNLTSLTTLDLRSNQLTGEIPEELGNLASLRYLDLNNNQLTGEIPASLGNLANLKIARFASNTDAEGNPSLTGCVPGGLRFLVTADEFAPGVPAHDFIPKDANNDGDTADPDDIPGLGLPFCMVSALTFSGNVTLELAFASDTATYAASADHNVTSTTVTATAYNFADTISITKGAGTYSSGDSVPLEVGTNVITITVTPTDGTPTLTYTVTIFRAGVDQETLMALYNSTGGASWTTKTNWGETGVAIGMWEGVITNGSGSVTALDLPGNNLSGTLPALLGTLTSLTMLDLSDNRLSGTIPDLGALSSLTTLNLGDNQVSGTIPDWLGSLIALQDLSLRDNRLTGPIPEELGDLDQLRDLYLNGNQLSGCVPDQLRAGLTNHDFIAVDANGDGDTTDAGDTPGLPFCTLNSLAFSGDVTLNPEFTSSTTTYTASAAHDVEITTVTAPLNNSSNTVSIMKGTDTPTTSVPLDVGSNVITIEVTRPDDPLTPHIYTVTVTRQPNTPPAFDEGAAATRGVAENTGTGVDIGDPVAATDPDSGDTLTYSLDAAGTESFDIDASSGQLRTKAALDYETENSYSVTMSVSDGKDADGNADEMTDNTITVTILVSNVNEALAFPSTTDTRTIPENTAAGVNLGAPFTATDGDNDLLTYSLGSSGNADSFSIDAVSGQLQTKAPLDYETTPSYTVTVTAEDPSGEADTITVTITVTNVEEAGTVTLSTVQPIEGIPLAATLDDPDEVGGSVTWSWESSPNGSSSWTPISGATTDTYGPVAADVTSFLRATATYDDGHGSNKIAQVVSANRVLPALVGPNEPPEFPLTETRARDVDENTPAGEDIGEPVAATDPDNDILTYSLDAAGATSFDIGSITGQLRTKAALDFETTASYSVTVTATDTAGGTGTIPVTITVNNLDEPGTVTLSSQQPLVAIQLTATLDELDDVLGRETWLWARSPDGTSPWITINGETSDTYTPVAGDVGDYLQATAFYTDGAGPDKSAQAISANAVEVAPGRNKPVLREHPTATRSVARNTPAGRNIGAPFSATDADNDALTYSLDGPDAAEFDLNRFSGQLLTKAPLTGINRTSYEVLVSVSDSKDDLGDPDTAIDATTRVTINVTTTRSGGSGGGGGGGRGRATPTPTPSPTPTATPTPTGPQFSGLIAAEPSVTGMVVPEGATLGLNGGGDLPGGVYVNFPPTAVALPVHVSVSVSNEAPSDVVAPSGTTLLPLTIDITLETPLILGEPLTLEINPTPEQLAAAGGDLNKLAVGVVTPHGIVVLPAQVLHGRLVVTTDRLAPFVLLAITDTGPVLTQPPMGDASSMGPLLQWTQPPQTTWFQVQVIPFNEDGPGINLVIGDRALVRGAQYQVLGPNFGSADPNYVMLPGMTYLWRVRTTTVLTNPTEADWSAWAVSSFKTPPASSSTITPVAPPAFGQVSTLTPTLTWANSNTTVFYYEVQVSKDYEFGPNAFLYSEYVHGGASTPPNSYVVPAAFPLEAGEIYYWRVRPRIQGDGDPLPWSATYVFQAPPG